MGTVSAYNMANIHSAFGRGNDLNSYRGTTWWTDGGSSGTFGVTPIYMSEFMGKRPDNPDPYPYDSVISVTFDGSYPSAYAYPGTSFGHSVNYIILGGGSYQILDLWYADSGQHHGAMNVSIDGNLGLSAMTYNGSGNWRYTAGSAILSVPGTYTFRFEASTNT